MKILISLLAFLLFQITHSSIVNAQENIFLSEYASGFTKPVDISHAGDSRLFIVEQAGRIEIIDSSGSILPSPFLNIQARVKSTGSEQGLLGLAFHPNYSANGYFFVNYIGNGDSSHISRFSVDSMDANLADPQSEVQIMTIAQPYANHNGGDLNFGPDGFLYIALGDGGSGGDPENRAQDSTTFIGKVLRIDIDNGLPYTIPSSNPFLGISGILDEIWAIGLRNPWRFSFDKSTGDLWIADVGQNSWEEIDFQASGSTGGENYGWRCFEGMSNFNSSGGCLGSSNYVFPIHQYSNTGFGGDCSVTGGYVYRGSLFPDMTGYYFYGDYCSGKIWSLHDSSGSWFNEFHGNFTVNGLSTFGEDNSGELYVAGLNSGKIFHLIDSTQVTGFSLDGKSFELQIFPNPFRNELTVELGSEKMEGAKVITTIREMTGGRVLEMNLFPGRTKIDLSYLRSGLYLLSISLSGESRHYKIFKK
jgi:glucose/arabinose dehydrogenase